MIALIPMEIGPLATNQAAISVRKIQKFTTMAKTVQLAYMHTYVPKTQRIYQCNAVKAHYTLSTDGFKIIKIIIIVIGLLH